MKSNKTLFHFSLLLLYVVFAVSCASMKNPSLIYYTDQNNNSFTISPSSLTYQGTKIENSSSGLYSGGKDRQIKISRPIFEKNPQTGRDFTIGYFQSCRASGNADCDFASRRPIGGSKSHDLPLSRKRKIRRTPERYFER